LALGSGACSSEDESTVGGGGGTSQGGTSQGGTSQGGTSQGGTSQGGTSQGGTSQGGTGQGGAADSHGAYHQTCVDKINELRATKGLYPYTRWTDAEPCVDQQSTDDEQSGEAHGHFQACGESAQNECLGGGMNGIEGCLDSMWGEKDNAACSGCDACADQMWMPPNCPNCDFYGGPCGHYVNMSAKYFTQAACGFSALGGWATIDFR
jgi:hypothetical protein